MPRDGHFFECLLIGMLRECKWKIAWILQIERHNGIQPLSLEDLFLSCLRTFHLLTMKARLVHESNFVHSPEKLMGIFCGAHTGFCSYDWIRFILYDLYSSENWWVFFVELTLSSVPTIGFVSFRMTCILNYFYQKSIQLDISQCLIQAFNS